jgi:hypothetical protein
VWGGDVKSLICRVEDPSSGRYLEARTEVVGEDVVVAVGGGERPHVGCVVLAQPYPAKGGDTRWSASCSVLTIPPHKEEPIARGIAEKLAATLGRVAVVTAGVHDDNIDADGIATYLRLAEDLAEKLVNILG